MIRSPDPALSPATKICSRRDALCSYFAIGSFLSVAFGLPASGFAAGTRAGGASRHVQVVRELIAQMSGADFRMRVQAALILGKLSDSQALPALKRGLRDKSLAVRAASASALGIFGDPSVLPSLRRSLSDDSLAVRQTVQTSIEKLERIQRREFRARASAAFLVKLSEVGGTHGSPSAWGAASQASRRALERLNGVALLRPSEEALESSRRLQKPVVLLRPSIRSLTRRRQVSGYKMAAKVDFLVHEVPGMSLVGNLTGTAEAQSEEGNLRRLELDVVEAAVRSALGRSRPALEAAALRAKA
ncbi:MAG: HEAT repeat domain-containing protein [Polyangiaceae bacterium]|nr:HEAT repeat domain-containing protein [Polyangiaceae bacterium]